MIFKGILWDTIHCVFDIITAVNILLFLLEGMKIFARLHCVLTERHCEGTRQANT